MKLTFSQIVFLLVMALAAVLELGVINYQADVITQQKALIKLQMQDSTDLAACRIAAARK